MSEKDIMCLLTLYARWKALPFAPFAAPGAAAELVPPTEMSCACSAAGDDERTC